MSIHTKLLEFQKLGITLKRDGTNPHFGSSYVTLNEVLEKVKGPLNDMGILIVQRSEQDGLVTELVDTGHASAGVDYNAKVSSKMPYVELSTAQKLGSNVTYLRRYSLVALLGLEDVDDDGNAASQEVPAYVRTGAVVQKANLNTPGCAHGPMKLVQVKKEGPNKGRFFYACPAPQGKQCEGNSFKWADELEPVVTQDEAPALGDDGLPF